MGVVAKNSILLVDYTLHLLQEGYELKEALIKACRTRLRPILMTSFAFIAGLLPLVVATGPGAIANHTIGACALGGMLFGTVFGVVLVPGLYYIFATLAEGKQLVFNEDEMPLTEKRRRK